MVVMVERFEGRVMIVVMVAKVVVRGMMVVVVIDYGSGGSWELLSGSDGNTVSWLPGVGGGHTVYTI